MQHALASDNMRPFLHKEPVSQGPLLDDYVRDT